MIKYRKSFSADYLRSILRYEPTTGKWYWLVFRRQQKDKGKRAGSFGKTGYHIIGIDRQGYHSARLAWLYMTGRWPKETIDHIDRNPRNNKWSNLREASHKIQNGNRRNCIAVRRAAGYYEQLQ